jgi:hypothetical protein
LHVTVKVAPDDDQSSRSRNRWSETSLRKLHAWCAPTGHEFVDLRSEEGEESEHPVHVDAGETEFTEEATEGDDGVVVAQHSRLFAADRTETN